MYLHGSVPVPALGFILELVYNTTHFLLRLLGWSRTSNCLLTALHLPGRTVGLKQRQFPEVFFTSSIVLWSRSYFLSLLVFVVILVWKRCYFIWTTWTRNGGFETGLPSNLYSIFFSYYDYWYSAKNIWKMYAFCRSEKYSFWIQLENFYLFLIHTIRIR